MTLNPNVYEPRTNTSWVTVMEHRYALVSVYDKEGVIAFSKELSNLGITILSTGGTAAFFSKAGILSKMYQKSLGSLRCLMESKNLHPIIHAGILARRDNKKHLKVLKELKINLIDFVVCNLYPFEKTIQKQNVSVEEIIENIDIGDQR